MIGSNINLYAANFAAIGGGIRVFDSSSVLQEISFLILSRILTFRLRRRGTVWEPYNIANLNGHLMVAYDPLSLTTHLPAPGEHYGVIAEFTTSGEFIRNFSMEAPLNDPWGTKRGDLILDGCSCTGSDCQGCHHGENSNDNSKHREKGAHLVFL